MSLYRRGATWGEGSPIISARWGGPRTMWAGRFLVAAEVHNLGTVIADITPHVDILADITPASTVMADITPSVEIFGFIK